METRKLSLSCGLLALVAVHALLLRAPLPSLPLQNEAPVKSFSFDTIESNIANPSASRVNATARDEVKRQQPNCKDCHSPKPSTPATPAPPAASREIKGQGTPATKEYNLDIFVGPDAQSQAILNFFRTYPQLASITTKCNYQVYAPGDALYKQRYSQWIPVSQFPAILMTRKDGGHVYIASKSDIPATAAGIHSAMYDAFSASVKAAELSKTSNVESNPNCVDGNCRKPPFWNRDPDKDEPSLFHNRDPDPTQLISSFLRTQGIGLESVALLAIVVVVIVLIFMKK